VFLEVSFGLEALLTHTANKRPSAAVFTKVNGEICAVVVLV
jgi:hypothetical protein